jgi:hypothetical protein
MTLNYGVYQFFLPLNLLIVTWWWTAAAAAIVPIVLVFGSKHIPQGIFHHHKVQVGVIVVNKCLIGGTVMPVKSALLGSDANHELLVTPTLTANRLAWIDGEIFPSQSPKHL